MTAVEKFIAEVRAAVNLMAFPEHRLSDRELVQARAFEAMSCVGDALVAFDEAVKQTEFDPNDPSKTIRVAL